MEKVRALSPDRSESFFSIASNDFHGAIANEQVSDAALDMDAADAAVAAAAAAAASEGGDAAIAGDEAENNKEKSWGSVDEAKWTTMDKTAS